MHHDDNNFSEVAARMVARANSETPEQKEHRLKREQQCKQEQHDSNVEQLRYNWNAPKRHLGVKLETLQQHKPWADQFKAITERAGKGFTLALIGNRGSGKTQLAVALMKKYTSHLKSAYYTTAIEFFMRVKKAYSSRESRNSELDIVANLRSYKLVVIDEANKRAETNWENLLLFELLDKRYQDMTDTLLIANQDRESFAASIGPSLSSRMDETGGIIDCNWQSFRG